MKNLKFRLRKNDVIVGYERWFEGNQSFLSGWEYSKLSNGVWIHQKDGGYIDHDTKEMLVGINPETKREFYENDKVMDVGNHNCNCTI